MIDEKGLDGWLHSTNARYRSEEIPHRHRPFKALSDFAREFNCSIDLASPTANTIFEWFKAHSQPGSHAVGALFTGAFYFEACFWPLYIPLGYGTFTLNALDSLETMPQRLKDQIAQSREDLWRLALYWADCCDYAYGFDDMEKQGKLNSKALTFAQNADRELAGAIAQLVTPRPNARAILALRMASEIFMKALLIQETNPTEQYLRNLGHNIEGIARECFAVTQTPEFAAIAKGARVFPDVSERYDGGEWKLSEVWEALRVAQVAATAVARRYTDRDMRRQIFKK